MQRAVTRLALLSVSLWTDSAAAAYREGFETPATAWRLADFDCRAQLTAHERVFQPTAVHSGAGAEYVRLKTEQGTTAHLTLGIPPARVIKELAPSLWIKASRAGMWLRGRLVLPRSRDPRDGSPMTLWVEGDVYDQPGAWQRLSIRDLPLQLQRQARVKRGQPQTGEIDEREAYLDLIVLNAYTAPGETDLWIDNLEVEGYTEANGAAFPGGRANALDEEWRSDDSSPIASSPGGPALAHQQSPHLEGSTLIAGPGPVAVRMIEHRGESWSWLKSLGFNTIRMPRPPGPQELEEARQLDLWIVAPPPIDGRSITGAAGITVAHDRVIAWDLGSDLGARELERARRLANAMRSADTRAGRPMLVGSREEFWGYRRFADVMLLGESPLGTAMSVTDFRSRMTQQASLASRSGPVWANLQTAPAQAILDQYGAIAGRLVAAPLEAAQVRLLALAALEAGATGFCFRSPAPLDAGDPAAQHRAEVLHALNEELSLVEPWIAGSSPHETLDLGSEDLRGTAWRAERSKLILVARHYADDQFTAAPAPPQPVSILLAGAPPSWKAYRLGADRLLPIWSSQVGGGMRINVPGVFRSAWIVVTDDPLTMNFLDRRLRQSLASRAKLRHEILSRELAMAEAVLAASPPGASTPDEGIRGLEEARSALRQCERLLDAGDLAGSLETGERVEQALTQVRRRVWWREFNAFASRVSSPCCASFAALPLHWELVERVRSSSWGPNLLAAGDFEDVNRMQSSGWIQERDSNRQGTTVVELSPDRPQQGRYSLHLGASADVTPSGGFEATSAPAVRIISPGTQLNAGDLARITGWVRGPSAGDQSPVFRVLDSLGGDAMADHPVISSEWRPFVLYRAAPRAAPFTVALELLGPGDIWIDSVSVEVLASPTAAAGVERRPAR